MVHFFASIPPIGKYVKMLTSSHHPYNSKFLFNFAFGTFLTYNMKIDHRFIFIFFFFIALFFPTPNYADIRDKLKVGLEHLSKNPEDKKVLKEVTYYYLNLADYDKALEYGDKLIELGKKTGDRDYAELHGLIAKGQTSNMMGDNQSAFRCLETARLIAEENGDHDALSSVHNGLGMYYQYSLSDNYSAIYHYFSSLEEAQTAGNERRYGIVLGNLSEAFLLGNDKSGLQYAEKAYGLAKKRGESLPLFYACLNLAQFKILCKDFDKVPSLLDEVEKYARAAGCNGSVDIFLTKAAYLDGIGQREAALEECESAISNTEPTPEAIRTQAYLTYGEILRKAKRHDAAIKALQNGLENARNNNHHSFVGCLLKELALCYRETGQMGLGLDYSLKYSDYLDSVHNVSRERSLQETRIKHEIYAKEKEIAAHKMELEKSNLRFGVACVVLFLLILLFGVFISSYRKKGKLYKAIVKQNSESIKRENALQDSLKKTKDRLDSLENDLKNSSQTTSLSDERADDLAARFTSVMLEERLFCNPSITLASVAERLNTNRTYLSKAINEKLGKTFTQVINDYRIHEAIRMMSEKQSNVPLKQLCYEVGFSSISTFYSLFQSVTGMTPAVYRSKLNAL